jgi:hypothetical protein
MSIGGARTAVGGYMPVGRSRDGGATFVTSKSRFAALSRFQRPAAVRLKSGRILVVSDFQNSEGQGDPSILQRGVMLAWSDDEGENWALKTLELAEPPETRVMDGIRRLPWERSRSEHDTAGHAAIVQASSGLIHLITSMNHPNLHFEFNEAWLTSDLQTETPPKDFAGRPTAFQETWKDGSTRASYAGIVTYDGHFVLNGKEQWKYASGRLQYEAEHLHGRKVGNETYWHDDGSVAWDVAYSAGDIAVWTRYWPDGKPRSRSTWRGAYAHGPALTWDRRGVVQSHLVFTNGKLTERK